MPDDIESQIRAVNKDVIDTQEALDLKEGSIDRVNDEEINTQADLRAFIHEQQEQAKKILEQKAKLYFKDAKGIVSPTGMKILKESQNLIDGVARSLKELNIVTIRVACSKLSDIVGFKLEIDENAADQFGLKKRYSAVENKKTEGFMDYAGEKMEKGKLQIWGTMEEVVKIEDMKTHDVSTKDMEATTATLRKFGKVTYQKFADQGPVLVLLPEMHYDSGTIRNNFDALMQLKKMIALLGFEGGEGEVKQGDGIEKKSAEDYKKDIGQAKVMSSSMAIEGALGEEIYTLGLENNKTLMHIGSKLMDMIEKVMKDPGAKKKMEKELRQMISQKVTKKDLIKLADLSLDKDMREILIAYRNQLWLRRIQDAYVSSTERGKFSSSSNMAFIVCGAAHVKDMASRAGHYGYKGVITFMPKAMDEVIDPKVIKVYMEQQLGVKLE